MPRIRAWRRETAADSSRTRSARRARRECRSGCDAKAGAELELFLLEERAVRDARDGAAVSAVDERGLVLDEAAAALHAGAGALGQEAPRRAREHALGRQQHDLRTSRGSGAGFGHSARIVQEP